MKAVGVIVEYNPFHNGHAFHIKEAKTNANADVVIAVMSGNFLQRGEPAIVSKWKRTKMALKAGVDIVFELPYVFATQQANTFASGAVSILEAAGCHSLCFGSESGSINSFNKTVSFLENHNELFQQQIKNFLDKGNSYPKATSLAYHTLSPTNDLIDLSQPNNILGYQYIKAANAMRASINIFTVPRKNANYHDPHFASETIASATSIRKALFSEAGQLETVRQYVPETTYDCLNEYKEQYGLFHDWELYWPYLKYKIVQMTPEQLKTIYEVEEGLENRILATALEPESFQQFMERLKTKRYTWTRLQRACVHILTNTTKQDMFMNEDKASYLRLLGMTAAGREYLNKYKSNFSLPMISKVSSAKNKQLLLDIKASRIYAMGASGYSQKKLLEKEFKQPPIIIAK